jgi:acyl-CoA reductase-like NAD-dependent aldehyde dehydrogenase
MELGGKSPAIVLPSADLKLAANNVCQYVLNPASRCKLH